LPAPLTGLTSFQTEVLIPEPSARALLVLGSMALVVSRRRLRPELAA